MSKAISLFLCISLILSFTVGCNNSESINTNTITTGTYIGQIDSHSIEIEISGQPKAFQILEVMDEFNNLDIQEGATIEFKYIEKETTERIITEIIKND